MWRTLTSIRSRAKTIVASHWSTRRISEGMVQPLFLLCYHNVLMTIVMILRVGQGKGMMINVRQPGCS